MSPNFGRSMTTMAGAALRSDRPAASYIWSERYFRSRLNGWGPSLLAGEVLLPVGAAEVYPAGAAPGPTFRADLGVEAILAGTDECTVIASVSIRFPEAFKLFPELPSGRSSSFAWARIYGGSPYGIGTWNSPFLRKRSPAKTVHDMRRLKKEIDPRGILIPENSSGSGPGSSTSPARSFIHGSIKRASAG